MSQPAYQLKGIMVVKGKTTPKGKSSAKGQTKGQVKGLSMQTKEGAHVSLSNTSVLAHLPVEPVVVSLPAGYSMMKGHVDSP